MIERYFHGHEFNERNFESVEEIEREREEKEIGIDNPYRLFFSPYQIEEVGRLINEKRASFDLRRNVQPEIQAFIDFAKKRRVISDLTDLMDLSLESRIDLMIAYEENHRSQEKGERKMSNSWSRVSHEEKRPLHVVLFIPTEKRREEIIERLPDPLRRRIKLGEVEITCFSDINDFRNRSRIKNPEGDYIYDLAIDSGVKVFTEINLDDAVVESKMGIESKEDMEARQSTAKHNVAIFDSHGGMADRYTAVPGRDYLRTIDDRALPLLEEIVRQKGIVYTVKEKKFNKIARRHLLLLGAIDNEGNVTEVGKAILDISKKLACSSQSARIIYEGMKDGVPANAILLEYLSRHEKPNFDLEIGAGYLMIPSEMSDKWNQFLKRNDAADVLDFLSNERVDFDKRLLKLKAVLGKLSDKISRSFIGMLEDLSRLYSEKVGGRAEKEELRKVAEVKNVDETHTLKLLLTGLSPNLMKMQATFSPMLKESEVSLVRPISGEIIVGDKMYYLDGKKDKAEEVPYFAIALNNRRFKQPSQLKAGDRNSYYHDVIVRVMNRERNQESVNVIGPFISVDPNLLKDISPEAWSESEEWFKEERTRREKLISENDPDAIAGPANLASLADAFKKRNPFE